MLLTPSEFVAVPYSDEVLPCLTVEVCSGACPRHTWMSFIIPLICLVEWDDCVVVDAQTGDCFESPDDYLAHANRVLPQRARKRSLRKAGLMTEDYELITPLDSRSEYDAGDQAPVVSDRHGTGPGRTSRGS